MYYFTYVFSNRFLLHSSLDSRLGENMISVLSGKLLHMIVYGYLFDPTLLVLFSSWYEHHSTLVRLRHTGVRMVTGSAFSSGWILTQPRVDGKPAPGHRISSSSTLQRYAVEDVWGSWLLFRERNVIESRLYSTVHIQSLSSSWSEAHTATSPGATDQVLDSLLFSHGI